MSVPLATARSNPRAAVESVPLWYHTINVAPDLLTPGYFDLRGIVEKMPWPDVRGKRCLDIGTWDGYLAFELERRGASEVVAIDLRNHDDWDFPPRIRAQGAAFMRTAAGPRKGAGFEVAKALLDSQVNYRELSVYDLSAAALGKFDVVVCGSLLLHLRDPLRALAAIKSVCTETFLSTNQIDLIRSIVRRRQPLLRLDGVSELSHWFLPNAAAHRQMVEAAGFDVERESELYSIPFGAGHPAPSHNRLRQRIRARTTRVVRSHATGGDGVPHHAILARPAF